jgi:hypothetical protein
MWYVDAEKLPHTADREQEAADDYTHSSQYIKMLDEQQQK